MANDNQLTKDKAVETEFAIEVKFGQIADSINTRVDPSETDLDVYVGLEHLDPNSLKLTEHGTPSDVVGQKLLFQPGDVIFGKRRAYQRKLAIAECEGICSAHAMVLREKPGEIEPGLLPFFMQSDAFMERAIDISVGSLSPTINWKTLKIQKFFLPPLSAQRRILELLTELNDATNWFRDSIAQIANLKRLLLTKLTVQGLAACKMQKTKPGSIPTHWQVGTVDEVTSLCQYGLSIPLHEAGQFPILRMMNYDDGLIVANSLKYVDLDAKTFADFKLQRDDILFNRTNSADLVGKVGMFRLEGEFVFASYLVRLKADTDMMLPSFLNYYLNSELGQRRILAYATPGVSQTNVSAGNLKKVRVPIPPMGEQESIVDVLDAISERKRELVGYLETLGTLKTALMDRFFPLQTKSEA